MISCAYALLLTAGGVTYDWEPLRNNHLANQMPNLERLVLLADNGENSFYGSYEPTYTGAFPKLRTRCDIYTTKIQNGESPTKSLAYCSPSLSSMEIISKLQDVAGLESEFNYPKPETSELYADICLQAIHDDWHKELDKRNNAKSSTELAIAQNDKCLKSHIIGLAFRGDISISGIYNQFAPTNTDQVPKINLIGALRQVDLWTNRQIYGLNDNGNQKKMLVWYFGNLHIFRRNRPYGTWWPVTKIGQEKSNARTILDFMRKELGVFKKLDEILPWNSFPQIMRGSSRSQTNNPRTRQDNNDNKLIVQISNTWLGIP